MSVTRFACLCVAHFQAAAHIRAEPGLVDRPLAILAGAPPTSRVVDANAAAHADGVVPGLTEADARARCPRLVTRPVSDEYVASAQRALLDAAYGVSPRVEDVANGVVYVDVTGLGRLVGDDAAVAERLHAGARRVALAATVGIADSRTAALVMARVATRVHVVPRGEDRIALGPVSVDVLALEASLRDMLRRWGVRTLGDLAALPRDGLGTRLGPAGLAAHDRALGVDRDPFEAWTPPPYWEEAQGVEWEIAAWDGLAPIVAAVLGRLVGRLAAAHLTTEAVSIHLGLATREVDQRVVTFAHPLAEVKPMLALIELDLTARPPGAAVTRVTVSARAVPPAPGQRGLWQMPVPAGRDLATTLARLGTLVGPDRVGTPVLLDSHHPDAVTLMPFAPPPTEPDIDAPRAAPALDGPLAFRRLRPPRVVAVETAGDEPVRVTLGTAPEPIVAKVGPWRMSGEWWDRRVWARDEWDITLTDGMICRLVHDRLNDEWSLDGAYD